MPNSTLKERAQYWLPVILSTIFLADFIIGKMPDLQVPSHLARITGLALILMSPLRSNLHWKVIVAAILPLAAWVALKEVQAKDNESVLAIIKGPLYLLALCAIASLLDTRQLMICARATAAACLLALAVYIGPAQLETALTHPQDIWHNGFVTPTYYTLLAVRLGLITVIATSLLIADRKHWLIDAPMALAAWYLLVVNGGTGGMVSATAAILFSLLMAKPGLFKVVLITGTVALATLYAIAPGLLSYTRLLNGRDAIYQQAFPHLLDHLWLGAGSDYFDISVRPVLPWGQIAEKYHCIYLDFLLSYGVLGAALLAVFAWVAARHIPPLLTAAGQIFICSFFVFFLVYGLIDLRPLWRDSLVSLLGIGMVILLVATNLLRQPPTARQSHMQP